MSPTASPTEAASHRRRAVGRDLRRRVVSYGILWVLAGAFLWQALVLPPPGRPTPVSAATFPTIVGTAMVFAATGMLLGAVLRYLRWRATADIGQERPAGGPESPAIVQDSAPGGGHDAEPVASPWRLVTALGATTVYVATFFPLGYALSTFGLLAGMGAYFWRRPVASLGLSAALTVGIGWLFGLLGITLPPGLLALPF
ncbi:tripartite tricarboxylate transporter TctB family protein [Solwaraspora sp. WMMD937]|uniref:tripartite tricarboxylate transporter TctB family protein n=1 Tax=Solwaraspora sp. WMMD937 TaxID=3016090 RepID=UPI00249B5699|nr:tripartite tricarboxylate transporter TctB family protein [Solwaraspora sp. WMMD937]WFE19962.1 tripartite tricarboxylate transporter TctB family protein [Solwaraspora sp. WMMD937]